MEVLMHAKTANPLANLARRARGVAGGKLLFGQGAGAVDGAVRVVDRFGTFDDHLWDARKHLKAIERAGGRGPSDLFTAADDINLDRLRQVDAAMPTLTSRWDLFGAPRDADGMTAELRGKFDALRAAGVDLTPQQFSDLVRDRGSLAEFGRNAKEMLVGEAPLATLKQRYTQGGLIGKGGVLTGDIVPPAALRRTARQFVDKARAGNISGALKEELAPTVLRTAGVWAPGLAFSYAVPALSVTDAYETAKDVGVSPLRAAGASAASGALSIAAGPFGWAQGLAHGPGVNLVHKAMGAPTLGEMEQMRAAGRGGGMSAPALHGAQPGMPSRGNLRGAQPQMHAPTPYHPGVLQGRPPSV